MSRRWVDRVYYFPHVACYPRSSLETSSFTTTILRITWRLPIIQMERNQKASQRTSPYQIGPIHSSFRLMLTSVFHQHTILRPIGQTWKMAQAAFRFPGRGLWAATRITWAPKLFKTRSFLRQRNLPLRLYPMTEMKFSIFTRSVVDPVAIHVW